MQNQCRQPGINVNVGCRIRNIACSYLPIAAGELVYPLVFTYRWYVCCVLCVTCAIVCITWWWRPGHTKNVDILIQCVCVWYFYLTVFTDNDQRQLAQRIRCAYQEYYCYRAFWVSTFYFSFGYICYHIKYLKITAFLAKNVRIPICKIFVHSLSLYTLFFIQNSQNYRYDVIRCAHQLETKVLSFVKINHVPEEQKQHTTKNKKQKKNKNKWRESNVKINDMKSLINFWRCLRLSNQSCPFPFLEFSATLRRCGGPSRPCGKRKKKRLVTHSIELTVAAPNQPIGLQLIRNGRQWRFY